MPYQHIAGYKFTKISDVASLREILLSEGNAAGLKGTILLSEEGINLNLSGTANAINSIKRFLANDERLCDVEFHETLADHIPYQRYKVKLKKEIITMRQPAAMPVQCGRAPAISPADLKQWLDEEREFILLDTRNDYEYRFGSFAKAVNPNIDNFGEFAAFSQTLDRNKPVVMFCTGGVRCEKAGLYMLSEGFAEVYQLDGGILGYFAKVGGAHYEGECFVFDERVAVDATLATTGTRQCLTCQGPIRQNDSACQYCS